MKRLIVLILILLFVVTGCNPTSDNSNTNSYAKYMDFIETIQQAQNVYIGTLENFGEQPLQKNIIVKNNSESGFHYKEEFLNITVKIQEVLKGNYTFDNVISDEIAYKYKDYLKKGEAYVFCTGFDYSKDTAYYNKNLFFAIKYNNDGTVSGFEWDVKKDKLLGVKPKTIQQIRSAFLPKYREGLELSKNIYMGKVESFEYDSKTDKCRFKALVKQAYFGDFKVNTVVEDEIPGEFRNFLKVGSQYYLTTGIDYASNNIGLLKTFNPYCAIEKIDEYSVGYYTFDKYGSCKDNIKTIFDGGGTDQHSIEITISNWLKSKGIINSEIKETNIVSDPYRDPNDN